MLTIATYFLYFIAYSFLGWVVEVVKSLIERHKFVNRGFLIGPVCPIYGCGVLVVLLVVGSGTGDVLAVFLKSLLVCSVLEYLTSFLMEKLFRARWWDYHRYKFNINGRICLETMIPFGLAGCVVVYFLQPWLAGVVGMLPAMAIYIVAVVLAVALVVDMVVSLKVLQKVKQKITREARDNTDDIRQQVLEWLGTNSRVYRRMQSAYPDLRVNWQKVRKKVERQARRKMEKVEKRAKKVGRRRK